MTGLVKEMGGGMVLPCDVTRDEEMAGVFDTLNTELPFPCVWISPWSRTDGLKPLRHSLVLNAITTDEDLLDDLINEPTVTNVYSGHHPTYETTPVIPHNGYLADFLMCNKGFIRD